jgi:hypothetical protein
MINERDEAPTASGSLSPGENISARLLPRVFPPPLSRIRENRRSANVPQRDNRRSLFKGWIIYFEKFAAMSRICSPIDYRRVAFDSI